MKELADTLEGLPFIAKVLLAIFFGPLYTNLIRLCRGFEKGNTVTWVLAIVFFVTGGLFGIFWLIDLIWIIMKKPLMFTE